MQNFLSFWLGFNAERLIVIKPDFESNNFELNSWIYKMFSLYSMPYQATKSYQNVITYLTITFNHSFYNKSNLY